MLLDYPFLTHKDDLKDLGVFIFGFGFLISLFYDRGTENVKTDFSAGFLEFQGNMY